MLKKSSEASEWLKKSSETSEMLKKSSETSEMLKKSSENSEMLKNEFSSCSLKQFSWSYRFLFATSKIKVETALLFYTSLQTDA